MAEKFLVARGSSRSLAAPFGSGRRPRTGREILDEIKKNASEKQFRVIKQPGKNPTMFVYSPGDSLWGWATGHRLGFAEAQRRRPGRRSMSIRQSTEDVELAVIPLPVSSTRGGGFRSDRDLPSVMVTVSMEIFMQQPTNGLLKDSAADRIFVQENIRYSISALHIQRRRFPSAGSVRLHHGFGGRQTVLHRRILPERWQGSLEECVECANALCRLVEPPESESPLEFANILSESELLPRVGSPQCYLIQAVPGAVALGWNPGHDSPEYKWLSHMHNSSGAANTHK